MSSTPPSNAPPISLFGNTPLSPSRAISTSSFLANDELISILPSFHHPQQLDLLSGPVGPFRPGIDTPVPLWLAIMLRRRRLAKIIPPNWMDPPLLKEVLRFERDVKQAHFSPLLPFRHAEIARAILGACGVGGESEIPEADKIKLLLEDISTVRMDKIRKNVHTLSSQTLSRPWRVAPIIDVTNIGSLEMHAIRPFVTEAFRLHGELCGKGSSYSQPVPSVEGSEDNNGETESELASSEAGSGRGRLRASRLVREDEELMVPRPLEAINDGSRENDADEDGLGDENVENARSRIRRHR